jgi:hypothetical protein
MIMSTLAHRLLGSVSLNANSYEEVEADTHANIQAIGIVVLSSVAAAVGTRTTSVASMAALVVVALTSWVIWVLLTLMIGTQLLPGDATRTDFGQLLRTTGFSAAPGILRVFGAIPVIGWAIFLAATIWMLFSFVIAVRQALDYTSTASALAVCLLGWLIHGVLFFGFVMVAV